MHDELRDALKRVEPPAGFAERVMAQVRLNEVRRKPAPTRADPTRAAGPFARWAIAATLILAASGGTWYGLEMRRREAGEEAKRQVLVSLNIAGSKLRAVQMKINHEQER